MATETFRASRWTKGNHVWSTVIEITDAAVVRRKRSWFTVNEISIHLSKVAEPGHALIHSCSCLPTSLGAKATKAKRRQD
jgi:hypothetical protein